MKALICEKPGKLEYVHRSEPQCKAAHSIVRIRNIGICGTDLHAYEGTQPFFNYPRILGHELSGELVDADDLSHVGRYVLIGLQKEDFVFNHPEFHKRETTLMSSRNATRLDFDRVIHCMSEKKIQPLTFITHRVKFDETAARFSDWLDPSGNTIKVMVEKD